MLNPLVLSSAECNCIIEAIEAANNAVVQGSEVYAIGGYEVDQRQYAAVTSVIAQHLAALIEEEHSAIIHFEP